MVLVPEHSNPYTYRNPYPLQNGISVCGRIDSLSVYFRPLFRLLGIMNTEKSAIRILKDDLDTSMNQPRICLQCEEMKCLEGEDVVEELEKREFVWGKERIGRCSFKGLGRSWQDAYHCDLCSGNPQCVRVLDSQRSRHGGILLGLQLRVKQRPLNSWGAVKSI